MISILVLIPPVHGQRTSSAIDVHGTKRTIGLKQLNANFRSKPTQIPQIFVHNGFNLYKVCTYIPTERFCKGGFSVGDKWE